MRQGRRVQKYQVNNLRLDLLFPINHNNFVLKSPLNLKLQGLKFCRSNPAEVNCKAKHQKELSINQGHSVQSLPRTNK